MFEEFNREKIDNVPRSAKYRLPPEVADFAKIISSLI